jgi:serine/threonine protein kinase
MGLSPAQWSKVEVLFADALALPPAERRRRLDGQTGDPAVRVEVEALLSAADTGAGFLASPAAVVGKDAPGDSLLAGARLGPWRVLRLVGRGGMGEVYEAERADGQFEQRAALKVLLDESEGLLDRFHAERQILATLDHPGIARLLDGGVTLPAGPTR